MAATSAHTPACVQATSAYTGIARFWISPKHQRPRRKVYFEMNHGENPPPRHAPPDCHARPEHARRDAQLCLRHARVQQKRGAHPEEERVSQLEEDDEGDGESDAGKPQKAVEGLHGPRQEGWT